MPSDLFRDPARYRGPSTGWIVVPGLALVVTYLLAAFGVVPLSSWLATARLPLTPAALAFLGIGLVLGGAVVAALRYVFRPLPQVAASTTARVQRISVDDLMREQQEAAAQAVRAAKLQRMARSETAPQESPPDPDAPHDGRLPSAPQEAPGAPVEIHGGVGAASIEEEIKQLNRQISRASVKLGLGEISNDGYVRYTKELRDKVSKLESKLEAERYRIAQEQGKL